MNNIAEAVGTEGHIQDYKLELVLQEEHNRTVLFHSNHVVTAIFVAVAINV